MSEDNYDSLWNGYEIRGMGRVDEPVIVVLVCNKNRLELAMVDPDISACLNN